VPSAPSRTRGRQARSGREEVRRVRPAWSGPGREAAWASGASPTARWGRTGRRPTGGRGTQAGPPRAGRSAAGRVPRGGCARAGGGPGRGRSGDRCRAAVAAARPGPRPDRHSRASHRSAARAGPGGRPRTSGRAHRSGRRARVLGVRVPPARRCIGRPSAQEAGVGKRSASILHEYGSRLPGIEPRSIPGSPVRATLPTPLCGLRIAATGRLQRYTLHHSPRLTLTAA